MDGASVQVSYCELRNRKTVDNSLCIKVCSGGTKLGDGWCFHRPIIGFVDVWLMCDV